MARKKIVFVIVEGPTDNDALGLVFEHFFKETTICSQLKLKSSDGKRYNTAVDNTEHLLRTIQSIPSKKTEPFKLWLAQVGRERIEETLGPELIAERLVATYERKVDFTKIPSFGTI